MINPLLQQAHASGQLTPAQSWAHHQAGELSLPCPDCHEEATDAQPVANELIERFGRGVTDVFEQMLKGNWVDDHGHEVSKNKAMLALMPIVEDAISFRAAPQPVIAPDTGGQS